MRTSQLALAALVLVASSCSTAGPFVTSIKSDGRGGLIIEKSKIRIDFITHTVAHVDHKTTTIQVIDLMELKADLVLLAPAAQQPSIGETK